MSKNKIDPKVKEAIAHLESKLLILTGPAKKVTAELIKGLKLKHGIK